jgi:hypothetical protein
LAEGLSACLWQIGGVPRHHRTDNLSAAVVQIDRGERHYTQRYLARMQHYDLQPSTNQPGEAHENGDVEQAQHRFKQAVDQALRMHGSRDNEQAQMQNGHILSLLKTTETLIAEYTTGQARVMELYKRGSLDADRWEVEDRQCQQKIDEQMAQKQALEAKLVHTYYSPAYIRDVKAAGAKISEGMNHFTRQEKRETFDLLDLHGKFAIEDGYKVVYAECILDARRLVIKANGGDDCFANRSS